MIDHERIVRETTDAIASHPGAIVAVTLVVTVLLLPGMALLSTDSGTGQFAEDVDAYDAFQSVNQEFDPAFGNDNPSTQLIVRGDNVLSRPNLVAMLETKEHLAAREDLRVVDTSSPASRIALELDPGAQTLERQRETVEAAPQADIDAAVRELARDPSFGTLLSEDFNPESPQASAMLAVVTHEFPEGGGDTRRVQTDARDIAERTDGDVVVFGGGIVDDEFGAVIGDSLVIVVPAALVLILALLSAAYRDPVDFVLGALALIVTVVWTFGFTGYAGIPFNELLIAVPVLLLAIGIDFGIHTINRYREERIAGEGIDESMETAMAQLLIAFAIIAGTTVIGFLANLTSELGPIQDFGLVAGIGIVFTLLIFGVALPAAKVWLDRYRVDSPIPEFGTTPLGNESSLLGRVLPHAVSISRPSPAIFMLLVVLLAGGAGYYGAGVDTTFDDEDFLPPEEEPAYVSYLPGPIQPSEYTVTETINYLGDNFETAEDDTVTVYVEGRLAEDHALVELDRRTEDPPDSFVTEDGTAEADSILTVVELYAEEDPAFDALVDRNDLDGDGVPQRNLDLIYDELLDSPYGEFAREYITEDYRSTRVVFEVEASAEADEIRDDAEDQADAYRFHRATATGEIVVFQAVSDVIFESALVSLTAALVLAAIFLVIFYHLLVGRATLGAVNLVPVVVTICLLTAAMRAADVPFNAMTATILAITIGLGVDYTVHVSHRFYDEYEETDDVYGSIETTLRGTGGALTGTMLTTVLGIGVLTLAITPILGQFGLLTGLSILLAYVTSLVILPPALVLWVAAVERRPALALGTAG